MAINTTEAVVLKKYKFRDTSLIGIFYTREFGKIKGIIKGIRGLKSGYGSTLEPFSLNTLVFYEKSKTDLHIITKCDLKEYYKSIRQDIKKTIYAAYFISLLNEIAQLNDVNEEVFKLISSSLSMLNSRSAYSEVIHTFEIKLLALSGFMPRLDMCVFCEKKVKENGGFSSRSGGLVCSECLDKCRDAHRISHGAVASIKYIEALNWNNLDKFCVTAQVQKELNTLLRSFLDIHLGKRLKPLIFLQKINNSRAYIIGKNVRSEYGKK